VALSSPAAEYCSSSCGVLIVKTVAARVWWCGCRPRKGSTASIGSAALRQYCVGRAAMVVVVQRCFWPRVGLLETAGGVLSTQLRYP
jgi:hypothetical protein